jgi:mono/diheme cytochrome c family protein
MSARGRAADDGMTMVRATGSGIVAALLAAMPLVAQETDISTGRGVAERLCAECHGVRLGDLRSPNAAAPTFPALAAAPGLTAASLRAAVSRSHRTIPDIVLPPDQLEAIVAYIVSLGQPG